MGVKMCTYLVCTYIYHTRVCIPNLYSYIHGLILRSATHRVRIPESREEERERERYELCDIVSPCTCTQPHVYKYDTQARCCTLYALYTPYTDGEADMALLTITTIILRAYERCRIGELEIKAFCKRRSDYLQSAGRME